MTKLGEDEITTEMDELDGWQRDGEAIAKAFDRGDFKGSVAFVEKIVGPAEEMNHHPDLAISWSEVKVSITNHAEGGLTHADFALARAIDELA